MPIEFRQGEAPKEVKATKDDVDTAARREEKDKDAETKKRDNAKNKARSSESK